MHIEITLTENEISKLIYDELHRLCGNLPVVPGDVQIQVKSKQNYKSEWEAASFRATLVKYIDE